MNYWTVSRRILPFNKISIKSSYVLVVAEGAWFELSQGRGETDLIFHQQNYTY